MLDGKVPHINSLIRQTFPEEHGTTGLHVLSWVHPIIFLQEKVLASQVRGTVRLTAVATGVYVRCLQRQVWEKTYR